MRRSLLLLFLLLPLATLFAQDQHRIDSIKAVLNKTKDPFEKFGLYQALVYLEQSGQRYKGVLLLNAELSGSTELQLRTYRLVSQLTSRGPGTDSAQFYLDKMFALAKETKNSEYQGWYYLFSAYEQYYGKNNPDKAMGLAREAISLASDNHFDSLNYEANFLVGTIHSDRGERLLEYKSLMHQLTLAEEVKDGRLALGTYWKIFWFYNNLKQYRKAKECALQILKTGKEKNFPGWLEGGNHLLTHYYTNVGEFETAKYYYDETTRLRKESNSPVTETNDLLDIYGMAKDYSNMLVVLRQEETRKNSLKEDSTGYSYYMSLSGCYTQLGKADSAAYFLEKMRVAALKKGSNLWEYYVYLGNYYKLMQDADRAALSYARADSAGGVGNNIDERIQRFANLDTLYTQRGDFQKAYQYKTLWMKYKDSAAALSKEGDLVALEIEAENQRTEAATRARHNIQYMGITAGLATVFILLALLGVFSSSTAIIRGLSFFAFIFFFEFLILLFDNAIHQATHGEPLKVLSIKIVLIALLLPLHHYVEHKVVHHLVNRRKINLFKWRKAKPAAAAEEGKVG